KTKERKAKNTGITQDGLNPILKDKILSSITPLEPKALLTETWDEKTVLEKHLYKYTRKVTSDFFIHKNLKEFLERELDYFIKTEVLDIESFDTEKERYFDRHITRSKVVKNIGERIIAFLSQIEDYQKMLWEKKKFVLKTDYVITVDRIPEEDFYKEILENKEQLKEWQELGFGKIKTRKDLNGKKLPVDTKYFTQDFKEKLLEKLSEKGKLEDLLDGILVKSENWQALNLLLEKYKDGVQCIYIDPPFNTGNDEFIYKDKYQHSSWLSMMHDRLDLAKLLLKNSGIFYVHCDYNENMRLRLLLDDILGTYNFLNEIIYSYRIQGIAQNFWARKHQTLFLYKKSDNYIFNNEKERVYYEKPFIDTKIEEAYIELNDRERKRLKEFIDQGKVFPNRYKDKLFNKYYSDVFVRDVWDCDYTKPFISGSKEYFKFSTQKSEGLLRRVISSTSNRSDDYILDFMLGSGTTTAVAHKLRKKWIGIEMGKHFQESYYEGNQKKMGILGRMKNVLAGDDIGISKDINWQGGGFFKYHYLEQYEDSLHNIEFPQEQRAQKMLDFFDEAAKTEYLMKYMLKFETEGSPSLLNLEAFESPFEYKLKIISNSNGEEIVGVDLVETFNYLIGFKVNKYKFLKENGRKYVVLFAERNNRRTAIVWRSFKNIDLKIDKEIIDKELANFNPDEIFINGDSFVKGYKPIESEFKTLMGV
ncbi:MAG: DNA methyltransferase, partial [Candidatus Heimdallarchaeaceae archaeon]